MIPIPARAAAKVPEPIGSGLRGERSFAWIVTKPTTDLMYNEKQGHPENTECPCFSLADTIS